MPSSRRASCTGVAVLGEVGDDLGVALGAELVPSARQLAAQLAEVVDLAVEHGADRRVLVGDRRIAGDEVDDRQAILRDSAGAALELPPCVRAAMVKARELLLNHR